MVRMGIHSVVYLDHVLGVLLAHTHAGHARKYPTQDAATTWRIKQPSVSKRDFWGSRKMLLVEAQGKSATC